jgi:hypothetical protein
MKVPSRNAQGSLTTTWAVAIGTLVVNVPVFGLLFGPAVAAGALGHEASLPWVLPFSLLAAWGWWSLAVPRWRLWAYARVASTGELRQKAETAGLVWPRGSLFERTEIRTSAQRLLQEKFERELP